MCMSKHEDSQDEINKYITVGMQSTSLGLCFYLVIGEIWRLKWNAMITKAKGQSHAISYEVSKNSMNKALWTVQTKGEEHWTKDSNNLILGIPQGVWSHGI